MALDSTDQTIEMSRQTLNQRVRHLLPHLDATEAADVARVTETLVRTFRPERIYVFGSQARRSTSYHSDLDLFVVVPEAAEFPHRLAQEAYRAIGHHVLPLDMVFMGSEEFDWRAGVVASLPATVQREGQLLYATATS
jgi:uncharacterized protein